MTLKEAPYAVFEKQDAFEIRDCAPHVVAETVVEGEVEETGNEAFNKLYLRHKEELESWIQERERAVLGEPAWARYDAPFIPWFMRRNEIPIPAETGADPGHIESSRNRGPGVGDS